MQRNPLSTIEKYHLYRFFPLLGVLITLITIDRNLGCLFCDGVDIRTYYYGIQTSLFDPANTFNPAYYIEREAWYYVYLPFFALIFYPLTIWGLAIFEILFVIIGLVLFIITLGIFDHLMEAKGVLWLPRTFYLVAMTLGTHFEFHFFYGQSKFYVIFCIALILYGDHHQWSPGWIHLFFLFLLTIMTHFLFVYAYYVIRHLLNGKSLFTLHRRKNHESATSTNGFRLNKRPISPEKKIDIKQTLLILCFIVSIFVLGNILFLVHPVLIQGYLDEILYHFIFHPEVVLYRYTNAVIPYLLYTYGEISPIYPIILVGIYIIFLFMCLFKHIQLLDVLAGYCCLNILLNYLNEPHYYVFFFPILLVWTACQIQADLPKTRKIIERIGEFGIYFIISFHQAFPDSIRAVLYIVLLLIFALRRYSVSEIAQVRNRHQK